MKEKSDKIKASSWYLKHSVFWISFSIALAWYGMARAEDISGFSRMFYEFESIKGDPGEFHEIYKLGNAEIHIVSNRGLFGYAPAKKPENGYGGYTVSDLRKYPVKEIWVIGKRINGEMIVNWAIIGHEIMHVLAFENRGIMNPDEEREKIKEQGSEGQRHKGTKREGEKP